MTVRELGNTKQQIADQFNEVMSQGPMNTGLGSKAETEISKEQAYGTFPGIQVE